MKNCSLALDSRWSNGYFTDCTHDNWSNLTWYVTSTGKTYRRHTFNLHVSDVNGNAITGALVTLWDKNGTQIFSESTDGNGNITERILNAYWIDQASGTTWNSYSPFTIKIEKGGFTLYTGKIDITEKTSLSINMKASTPGLGVPGINKW